MLAKVFYFGLLINSMLRAQGDDLLNVSPDVKLFETPKYFQSTLKEFKFGSCGGPAKIVDFRCEGCDLSGVCKLPSDGKSLLCQFTFVPSASIPGGISLRFVVTPVNAASRTYDIAVPNISVKGGTMYTLETRGSPNKDLKGKALRFQYMVVRKAYNFIESCAQSGVQIA